MLFSHYTLFDSNLFLIYTVSQKSPTFGLLELWRTWVDFDIFRHNCYR